MGQFKIEHEGDKVHLIYQVSSLVNRNNDLHGMHNDIVEMCRDVVVDMASVKDIGSEGLGSFLALRRELRIRGKNIVLTNVTPEITNLIERMRIDFLLPQSSPEIPSLT